MNIILGFMDKIYSDSKTLSVIYVVGAVLLFVFIILLMLSLRNPVDKEETKIIEEPKIDDEPQKEKEENVVTNSDDVKEEIKEEPIEQSIFEKTTIIPLAELTKNEEKGNNIAQALENVEKTEEVQEEVKEEPTIEKEIATELSVEIPNVDDFVDNVVKKTYEKNEQFSSVYVGNNTSTIKLDKVMEDLNVDDKVVDKIVPEEEKTIEEPKPEVIIKQAVEEVADSSNLEIETKQEEVQKGIESPKSISSLDSLKKALEEKNKEVTLKQDDLKSKLESLKKEQTKSNDTIEAEDLLKKLNSIKEK